MVTDISKTDNIQNIINPKSGTSKTDKDAATLAGNLDDFLKLLTTQLKNQDPTSPMETEQFTQQIAQLSTVEQQINSNKKLDSLVNLYATSQINGVVGYIGKDIEAEGNKSYLSNGSARFVYTLEKEAKTVDMSITDASGNVVFSGSGTTVPGRNEVFWNGKNSFTGKDMPDGIYTFSLKAKDAGGTEIKSTTATTGVVSAVNIKDGKPSLMLGDFEVAINKVTKVSDSVTL